ncbi:phage scaffolding protein [Bacillus sp. B15-48]|uniref:phage scaffolding protein n=1 Tax=Bacillus sp. B15-48 TaxID=1548601 RepID=UPI00193F489A|nr:phage scaffolding protein [Bacillus sp. B15-48]MBM4762714.1 scaffolding protein [Bacillus sp. B15-48]
MNREFLKNLGLEDEAIDKIMSEHGKTVNKTKEQLDSVTTERDNLNGQIKERDNQLEDLKVKANGSEALQQQIQQLQDDNKKIKSDYEAKIQQQVFDHTLKDALGAAKVRNPKAAKALLNLESIKLDGDKLLGLEDQLKAIKESDPYLFEAEQQSNTKPNFTTGQHQTGGGNGEPTNLQEALSQHFSQQK